MPNGWSLGGNAVSQGDFLGTTNNEPLSVRTNGTEHLRIESDGTLHVKGDRTRLESGNRRLDLRADGADVDIQSDTSSVFIHASGPGRNNVVINPFGNEGNVGIGTTSPGTKLEVVGDIRANDVIVTSDVRLKANVVPVEGAMAKLQKIRGVQFAWLDRGHSLFDDPTVHQSVGVIAQDVESVFPELVDSRSSQGYKGVNYSGLTAVLIQAFNELLEENAALKRRIEAVESSVAREGRPNT